MGNQVQVPFVDLSRIHAPIKREIMARIESIIDRSAFVLGAEVENFEKEFAAFAGTSHAVGVSNGLDALKLALQALGVGPGDEVITAANTFIATAYAITTVGAKVVLVDADEETWNLDPKLLDRAITQRTKAIIPVHLYGQPASMAPILEIARARGVPVIEDSAQAHGATYQGRFCGAFGVMGCFSFYPGKNLGAMGEGGAITTSDERLRDRLRMLRNVGQKEKYHHEIIGGNSRLHTMQAAILSVKLPYLAAQNEQRVQAARLYGEALKGVSQLELPRAAPDRTHVFHLFPITLKEAKSRDALQKHLGARGIQTGIHYPIPIHLSSCYASLGKGAGSYPITERLAGSMLSLPIFPCITPQEINAVTTAIREFFRC